MALIRSSSSREEGLWSNERRSGLPPRHSTARLSPTLEMYICSLEMKKPRVHKKHEAMEETGRGNLILRRDVEKSNLFAVDEHGNACTSTVLPLIFWIQVGFHFLIDLGVTVNHGLQDWLCTTQAISFQKRCLRVVRQQRSVRQESQGIMTKHWVRNESQDCATREI